LLVLEKLESLEDMFPLVTVELEDIESIKPVEVMLEVSFITEHLWISIIQDILVKRE
jgi:hypothetical protein